MVSEWPLVAIREVAEVFDGPHATPKTVESGPIFLGIGALQNGRINLSETRHVTREDFKAWTRRVTPRAGDIVFSYETRLGEAALIPDGFECCLGRRMGLVRVDRTRLNPRFFLYLYLSPYFQELIRSRTIPGATVDRIALKEFPSFPIPLPDLHKQHAIAHVLGTLDDKIELNRRHNETLESMARALFQDWFVEFGPVRAKMEGREPYLSADLWQLFPDQLNDEGMPVGWGTAELESIAALVTNSVSPGKSPDTVFAHYSIPAFDAGRMPAMELGESIKSNKYIVNRDAVLVSKLNPQTPRVWLPSVTADRAICSTEFMQFVPLDSKNRPYLYCLMASQAMQEVIQQHVTGSTGSRQRAQPAQIAKVDVLVPPPHVLKAFNQQASSILSAVLASQRESQTVAQLRDALLPKLISGELRIKDAECFMEERAA